MRIIIKHNIFNKSPESYSWVDSSQKLRNECSIQQNLLKITFSLSIWISSHPQKVLRIALPLTDPDPHSLKPDLERMGCVVLCCTSKTGMNLHYSMHTGSVERHMSFQQQNAVGI